MCMMVLRMVGDRILRRDRRPGYLIALAAGAVVVLSGCLPGPAPTSMELLNAKGATERADETLPRGICGSSMSRVSELLAADHWTCDNSGGQSMHPDSRAGFAYVLAKAEFWKACRAHDICYWTPGRSLKECDRGFLADLKSECRAAFPPTNPIGILVPWMLNTFADGQVKEFGSCRTQCWLVAQSYKATLDLSATTDASFAAAQSEAVAVWAELEDRLGPEKFASISARLAPLIGEACFWNNVAGECALTDAANRIVQQVAEVDAECARLGTPGESCAVYHCGDFEQVATPDLAQAEAQGAPGCVASCADGVLRWRCETAAAEP